MPVSVCGPKNVMAIRFSTVRDVEETGVAGANVEACGLVPVVKSAKMTGGLCPLTMKFRNNRPQHRYYETIFTLLETARTTCNRPQGTNYHPNPKRPSWGR